MIGRKIGRYAVVARLGAGGMGEVYLARDESLDRAVALKILPPELVRNDERVRRFVQEAKSASSLSHPNIVTIHEIGETDVDGAHVHFIAMELVQGSTLKDLIHAKQADLRTLIRYLAQAAEGLAKAHAAGIVHRDLKPDNIMVTEDGFAKVLDFGLAKLTEAGASRGPDEPAYTNVTRTSHAQTQDGMILGTVGYMSPEQVQSKPLDHRSDIFSFGCILYEAATRQRPFKADTDLEALHKILKDKPPPVEELNPEVPADVRRLIRRCLAKTPEQRLQSMKDLALELAEIADEYDTLSVSSGSGASASISKAALGAPVRSRWKQIGLAPVVAIGVIGLTAGGWAWLNRSATTATDATSLGKMEVTRLADLADLEVAATSPDGRLLAYSLLQAGRYRLAVRQLATGRDVEVIPPQSDSFRPVQFSSDGNYLFYGQPGPAREAAIYQVASLGGVPRRIAAPSLDGEFAVSADGTQVAGITRDQVTRLHSITVFNVDGTTSLKSVTLEANQNPRAISWSPDGEYFVISNGGLSRTGDRLVAISLRDGTQRQLGSRLWQVDQIAWLPDATGLVVAGGDLNDDVHQLWLVSWPDGESRRITNDTSEYHDVSISADSKSIATVNDRGARSIWIAPAGRIEAARRAAGDGASLMTARNGTILFMRTHGTRDSIWSLARDGSAPRRLTPVGLDARNPHPAVGTDVIVFTGNSEDRTPSLWRMDLDGGGLAEIPGGGKKSAVGVSPDGRTVFFGKSGDPSVWKMPTAGGPEVKVADNRSGRPTYSPNGTYFYRETAASRAPGTTRHYEYEIVLVDGNKVVRTLAFQPGDGHIQWAHSSDALMFNGGTDGLENVWRMPIDGKPPQQVTRFAAGQLNLYFAWTSDGEDLFFRRNEQAASDVLLIRNFR